jgi:signal transduction histidine kinase
MKRMFEPFMQEDMGYSRRYEGNGLGLALVKKYCDLNKAAIDVESEKGKGSKFTVTFLKTENKPDI